MSDSRCRDLSNCCVSPWGPRGTHLLYLSFSSKDNLAKKQVPATRGMVVGLSGRVTRGISPNEAVRWKWGSLDDFNTNLFSRGSSEKVDLQRVSLTRGRAGQDDRGPSCSHFRSSTRGRGDQLEGRTSWQSQTAGWGLLLLSWKGCDGHIRVTG